MADIKYTMPPPTEDVEQMCLFRWADAQSGKYPELSLMYHTLYECDPAKNTACKHEWCAANHPNEPNLQCHRTTNPDFALKGTRPVQVDTRTGKEVIL